MGKEFSGKWEMVKLGAVAELITKGTTPTTLGYSFVKGGINFIKIESISSEGGFKNDKFQYVTEECHAKLKRSQLRNNDILFSIAGALGKTAIVTEDILPANTNQALAIIRITDSNICLNYILAVLKSNTIYRQFQEQKQGVAQLNLSLKNMADLKIPLPPLEIQKEIAKNLDLASELVKLYERKLEELDKLIQSVFYDMFGDPVTNEMGWEVEKLGSLVNLKAGKNIKANQLHEKNEIDKFPCYGGNGIRGYINEYSHEGEYSLIGRQGALCGNIQFVEQKFYATEHAVVVTPKIEIESKWMYYILKFLDLNRLQTGAAQPGLNIEILSNADILYVPLELQRKFTDIILEVENQKIQVQKALDDAQMLYNSLMQEYFD